MHILILGGTNDLHGCLDDYTKKRCDKAIELVKDIHTCIHKCIVHFSGGFNDRFNKMKNNISHSDLCMKYFLENITHFDNENMLLHKNNNSTVDEAINIGDYLKNTTENIKIITNDWHMERVKYLFNKTFLFYNINNFEFISIDSINEIHKTVLTKENNEKLEQLINKPNGIWKEWLECNYYMKYLNLKLVNKTDNDGQTIVNIRNENNEYFFNTEKFSWETFKNIFYQKYFSNEIPPYFITLDNEVIGFIGCKTTERNINDIGIMIVKKHQGKGLGKISLSKFLDIFKNKEQTIVSKILKTNIGSYKIFISNNFKLNEEKTTDTSYYLTYNYMH